MLFPLRLWFTLLQAEWPSRLQAALEGAEVAGPEATAELLNDLQVSQAHQEHVWRESVTFFFDAGLAFVYRTACLLNASHIGIGTDDTCSDSSIFN